MLADNLRKSILQAAIQGKLTEQLPTDGNAQDLLEKIRAERQKLIDAGKIKAAPPLPPISPDEIPFDIPENWQWVRLGDICSYIQRGKSPIYSEIKKYPVVAQKCNQLSGFSLEQAKFIDPDSIKSYDEEKILKDNDLLWNSTGLGTVGRMAIYDSSKNPYELAVADSHVTVIRPFKNIFYKFIFFFVLSPAVQSNIDSMTTGSTKQKELATSTIKNLLIPLPPLAEQKRIVAKVEELLAEIEPLEESEKALDQLEKDFPQKIKASLLQAAIQGKLSEQLPTDGNAKDLLVKIRAERQKLIDAGKIRNAPPLPPITADEIPFDIPENWQWVRLGDICEMYTGNSISEHEKKLKYCGRTEGFDFIATKDVSFENQVAYDNGVKIPFENNFKRAEKDSVLMCIEGGSAGRKIAVVDREVCFGNKLCNFNAYTISNYYIYFYLQSPAFVQFFVDSITGIIGGVGINKLKNILISLPPLAEQERIVARLEALLKEIEI